LRYFLRFSYFGTAYHGWQRQPNAITVQQVLEEACSTLLRQPVALVGAGRTDAGVHAMQMFAHLDIEKELDEVDFIYRLNAFLPADIAAQDLHKVLPEAHARFDAVSRSYEYWLVQEKNPFYKDSAHYVKHKLDIEAMNSEAGYMLKHADFECFSKSNTDVKTYRCKVTEAYWEKKENRLVFHITADRFLRNMVRAVVGTLLEIGMGKVKTGHMQSVLDSKDRGEAGASVPAKGLYLAKVVYPKSVKLNG